MTSLEHGAHPPRLSDADREHALEVLRESVVLGRVSQDTCARRMELVRGARRPEELHAVLHDLPRREPSRGRLLRTVGRISAFQQRIEEYFRHPNAQVFGEESSNEAGERLSKAVETPHRLLDRPKLFVTHGRIMSSYLSRETEQAAHEIWKELSFPAAAKLTRRAGRTVACQIYLLIADEWEERNIKPQQERSGFRP
jgi:hypothetical protein